MGVRTFIGLIPLILGCGQAPVGQVEPQFVPYVQEFEASTGLDASSISIRSGPIGGDQIYANCDVGTKVIFIDTQKMSWINNAEGLIYHEMGHCLSGLKHDATLDADGSPASLMYPNFINQKIWNQKKTQFIQRSFSH